MWNKPKIWREIQIKQTNVIISIQRLREISSEQYNGCGKFQAKQCNVCGKYGINFVSKVLVIFPVVGLNEVMYLTDFRRTKNEKLQTKFFLEWVTSLFDWPQPPMGPCKKYGTHLGELAKKVTKCDKGGGGSVKKSDVTHPKNFISNFSSFWWKNASRHLGDQTKRCACAICVRTSCWKRKNSTSLKHLMLHTNRREI